MSDAIRSRIAYAEYAAVPAINISRLKELTRSPLHYRHALRHPKESAPLRLGTASHVATLEPERFDASYAVWGERTESGRLRPRNGKNYDAFEAAAKAAGKTILTEDEHVAAMSIQRAVRGDETAMRYLESGDPEVSMVWSLDGRLCKGRVDWLTTVDGMPVIVGLKTARDCRPFIFGSAAAKLGYHLQWAFYHDGWVAIKGGHGPKMIEVVVESAPPHAVATYIIPSDIIEQGREEYQDLLVKLDECNRTGEWPGPVQGEQCLTLPSWAYAQDADDLSELGLEA